MVPRQRWYSQGYRANIVTYTIALFHMLIQKQYPGMDLDLMHIWTRQNIPDIISNTLAELSELVYYKLTDPERKVENVTQWCKQEACWKSVQSINYKLSPEIQMYLIGREERKAAEREAKADQRILTDAEIMTKIIEISQEQWQNALSFALNRQIITPDENTAMRIACQIPQKMPTPMQCKRLLAVLERLQGEGFKL